MSNARDWVFLLAIPLLLVMGVVQTSAAARFEVGGVKPNLVLLVVLLTTMLFGAGWGIVWAFIGGAWLDVFSGGPMGSTSLAMMAAALVASLGHRPLDRRNPLVPGAIALLGSLTYGVSYLAALATLTGLHGFLTAAGLSGLQTPHSPLPFLTALQQVIVPEMLYNTALVILTVPLLNRLPQTQDVPSLQG